MSKIFSHFRLTLLAVLVAPTTQLAAYAVTATPRSGSQRGALAHDTTAFTCHAIAVVAARRARPAMASAAAVARMCEPGSLSGRVEEAVCTVYGAQAQPRRKSEPSRARANGVSYPARPRVPARPASPAKAPTAAPSPITTILLAPRSTLAPSRPL